VEQYTLANLMILIVGCVATGIVIVIVTNRDSWMPIVRRIMSLPGGKDAAEQSNEIPANPQVATSNQASNNGLQSDAAMGKGLLVGQARALAAMVKAGKIGETEGIKIVFGVSPSSTSPRYQAARAALKAELARLDNHYPQRTPEQEAARAALGLKG